MANQFEKASSTELDPVKLKRMILRIYQIERQNTKTNAYSDKAMKEAIEKIIEQEAKKCY